MKQLLAINEIGGYPNFVPLYQSLGFSVQVERSMRKACTWLKQSSPEVIVAEYNFQSQFRDRTSNLETLMAVLEKYGSSPVIVFYEPQVEHKLALLQQRFALHATLAFPIKEQLLADALAQL